VRVNRHAQSPIFSALRDCTRRYVLDSAITWDGKPVASPNHPPRLAVHKPTGLVTNHRDEKGRGKRIFDDLPERHAKAS